MKSLSRISKKFIIIPVCIMIITLSVILLQSPEAKDRNRYRAKLLSKLENDTDFNDFENDLFRYEASSSSVTTAYTLHNPENYNIPKLTPLLTDFTHKDYARDNKYSISKQTISMLEKSLSTFSKDKLDPEDQITYDLLEKHLELSNELCDYAYYETMLGKTTGAAANIPVTLSEYPINDSADAQTYLELLAQVPTYFDDVILYEKARAAKGMGTPTFILKDTENELNRFIKNLKTDNNCFVTTFNERIKDVSSISKKERSKYISTNKYYVNQYIIPAYEELYSYIADTINMESDNISHNENHKSSTALNQSQSRNLADMPEADTPYGLSAYPGGQQYYELIVKDATGSYRSLPELIELTEQSIDNALSDVLTVATNDPDAYMYYCDHPVETGFHSPEGILEALSLMIREDYPLLENNPSYEIKTVPDSLAEMLSPAFYMIPAIDDYDNNTIYINPLYTSDENGNLFTTLAHEGFPGHLYQTVYFNNKKPSPIRQLLDYPGYVEGWATYVELNSFSFIDYPKFEKSLPTLYRCDTIINLALSSRIDMGVNYEGWTLNDTCRYFEELGFNSYYASDIYTYVVEAPGNYLSYFIGYSEIEALKKEYKNLKPDNFSEKDFHKALLDIGPADFKTIRKYLIKMNNTDISGNTP